MTDDAAGIWLFAIPFEGIDHDAEQRYLRRAPKGARQVGERQWAPALPPRGRAQDEFAGPVPLRRVLGAFDTHRQSGRASPTPKRLNAFIHAVASKHSWQHPHGQHWTFHVLRHGRVGDLLRKGYPRPEIKDAGRWASEGAFRVYLN